VPDITHHFIYPLHLTGIVIVDHQVFADDHVPDRLVHRERAVGTLSRALEPALHDQPPEDLLIHGPHGVGKTVLVRHTFERLEAKADVDYVYVRSMGRSAAGIIRAVLRHMGANPATNTPLEDLCLRLRERMTRPTVVVLDEGDDLPATALRRLGDVDLVGVIPIVHDADAWLSATEPAVRRRFRSAQLGLDPYDAEELADILDPRAEQGLRGSVDRSYLEYIGQRAEGAARTAIQTLRAAAHLADPELPIERVNVDAAYHQALSRIRRANLRSLPLHHHVVYEIVRAAGDDGVGPGTFHDAYDRVSDVVYQGREATPLSKRDRRRKLAKLDEYELIDQAENRHDTHKACDTSITSEFVDLAAAVDVPDER